MRSIPRSRILVLLLASLAAIPLAAQTAASDWGARGAAKDASLGLEDMLRYAIQDEYSARAEYAAIIAKFGSTRPFSNIIRSEETHIGWLNDAYASRGIPVPKDETASFIVAPATLREAFEAGVAAEIDNIAMYEAFLGTDIVARPENAALKALFTNLRDASKNHLAAFRNGLTRLP